MESNCQLHEDRITQKFNETIDSKVEFSVSTKLNKLTLWMVGFVSTVLIMLVGIFLSNTYWMGQVDQKIANQEKLTAEFILEQRKCNESISSKSDKRYGTYDLMLNGILMNQFVTMRNMNKIDPTFDVPTIVTRGGNAKDKF